MIRAVIISVSVILLTTLAGFGEGQSDSADSPSAVIAVPVGKYKEAPMLAALVAKGELPPVDERLPDVPGVVPMVEEIGSYGGTLHTFGLGNGAWNDLNESPENSAARLLRIDQNKNVEGSLARDYDLSDDGKSMTLYLRSGARWSDGAPFTADDILFKFEDMHWNDDVPTWDYFGNVSSVYKSDDYTVHFGMDEPFYAIEVLMAQWMGGEWGMFQPKHYLKKWHINYNDNADALAVEEGFEGWAEAFKHHFFWAPTNDIDKPTMVHWKFTDQTDTVKAWVRNPYYFSVDEAGQQLPYVDRVISTSADKEIYTLKAISGEADIAAMFTSADNWTLYKENENSGGYRVVAVDGTVTAKGALWLNQNHENPALRQILNDVRFRQALSLAIDRDEINQVVYLGLGVPMAATSLPSNSYHKDEWSTAYTAYDVEEANRLLDEIGLTARDKNGFRVGLDGETIQLTMEYRTPHSMNADQLTLIREHWQAVGLDGRVIAQAGELWSQRRSSLDHIFYVHDFETVSEIPAYNYTRGMPSAPAWKQWLKANAQVQAGSATLGDFEGGVLPGEEPPEEIKEYNDWALAKPKTEFLSKEYREINQAMWDYWADQVFVIGTVGLLPQPYLANVKIGNVPTEYAVTADWAGDILNQSAQLFWKEDK